MLASRKEAKEIFRVAMRNGYHIEYKDNGVIKLRYKDDKMKWKSLTMTDDSFSLLSSEVIEENGKKN